MSVLDLFKLDGKVALVTGGSRGLGLQMARALGQLGARVAISARKQPELEAAAAELREEGIEALAVPADLSKEAAAREVVDKVIEAYGTIDILVNNAGATWGAPAEEHPTEAWHKVMSVNVDGPFFLAREVGRRCMIPRRSGKIINLSSIAGLSGNPPGMETIAYNTSKGAILNFTRALAAEWGKYDINVNAICPGFFPSKMTRGILNQMGDALVGRAPLKRLGGEQDLMGVVALFASEAGRHITGQWLAVDGGATVG